MKVYAAAALALAVLVAGGWRILVHVEGGRRHARHRHRVEDQSHLRWIAMCIAATEKLPMRDGALDPYDLVRTGVLFPEQYGRLRSVRSGGPTDEEIQRGDYTNFPWERYRGDPGRPRVPAFPLLWDRRPDDDGFVLVAMSDGSVHRWNPETLARALAEVGIGR